MTTEHSTRPRTVAVIVNPAARSAVGAGAIAAAARPFQARGWEFLIQEADGADSTRALTAAFAAQGVGVVLVCGGDGALRQALSGLRGAGAVETVIGLIPAGTGNVWAREARIPRDLDEALGLLEHGARRRVDLGLLRIGFDGEPTRFVLACGAGLDAAIVDAVERRPSVKRALGRLAFALPGIVAGVAWRPAAADLEVDAASRHHARMLATIIANTSRYGGVAPVAGRARVDDGLLDIVTFEDDEGSSASHRLGLALEATRGDLDARAVVGVTYERGTRVVLTPERALPVQADGDVIAMCGPNTPLIVEVEPAAVTMLVGPGPNPLWGVPG